MRQVLHERKSIIFNCTIEHLQYKSQKWLTKINFTNTEQQFFEELLTEHIIGLCKNNDFKNAKLLLRGIDYEKKLSAKLIASINEHKINLALLIENIYLKKESVFRTNHEFLKLEVTKYIQNFKCIKKQVFALVLKIMKREKQKKLVKK